jgi:hypothetical protein
VIRTMLSPPMMTALVLCGVILAVAGTISLRHQRRSLPAVTEAWRALRTIRTEDRLIAASTVVLVLSAIVVAFILLR